jgi:hypothetical protein
MAGGVVASLLLRIAFWVFWAEHVELRFRSSSNASQMFAVGFIIILQSELWRS